MTQIIRPHPHEVIVKAPAGTWGRRDGQFEPPTPEEIVKVQAAQIADLNREIEKMKMGMETLANVAICLCWMYQSHSGNDTIVIPRELSNRMKGAQLTIGENPDRDILAKYTEREPYKLQVVGGE